MVSRAMVTVKVPVCWPPRLRGQTAPVQVYTVLVVTSHVVSCYSFVGGHCPVTTVI